MTDKRTALQCQASGCDGCVVCDRENFTHEQLAEYREFESQLNHYWGLYEKSSIQHNKTDAVPDNKPR